MKVFWAVVALLLLAGGGGGYWRWQQNTFTKECRVGLARFQELDREIYYNWMDSRFDEVTRLADQHAQVDTAACRELTATAARIQEGRHKQLADTAAAREASAREAERARRESAQQRGHPSGTWTPPPTPSHQPRETHQESPQLQQQRCTMHCRDAYFSCTNGCTGTFAACMGLQARYEAECQAKQRAACQAACQTDQAHCTVGCRSDNVRGLMRMLLTRAPSRVPSPRGPGCTGGVPRPPRPPR